MLASKKIACIIPARLKSSRFPKKVLALLRGKPLLQWVWEAASRVSLFDEVVFAIDAEETARCIEKFGGIYYMTSESCLSGSERLVELCKSQKVRADIWVNWQGDEPFIQEQMIRDLLQTCQNEGIDVWTLKKRIFSPEEIQSSHVTKVVTDKDGFALYFSRSTIPFYREDSRVNEKIYYKHIGIYAFSEAALQKMDSLTPCYLEEAEQLEQLRFLYHQLKIQVHETHQEVFGIDLPEHLTKAEFHLKNFLT